MNLPFLPPLPPIKFGSCFIIFLDCSNCLTIRLTSATSTPAPLAILCFLEGFKIGADDYITKPFSMEELLLRIEAVLRRSTGLKPEDEQEIFKIGKLTFNSKKQTLFDGEEEQKLTTKESELLKLLCLNVNKVLERNYALKNIWADDNYFNARSMDVYITKLRKHLKKDPSVEIINVHGKGYKLIL